MAEAAAAVRRVRARGAAWQPPAGLVATASLLVVWQAAAVLLGEEALAGPLPAAQRLLAMLAAPRYRGDFLVTLGSFLLALAISWGGGLALAAWFGLRRFAAEVGEPMLASFYAVPKVTLYPIVLLLFGLGTAPVVAFGVMHGIVPVVLIGAAAIRNLRPAIIRTARMMRLGRRTTMLHVLLPAIMPELLTGFSLTLLGTLIGQMFGGKSGLGFLLMRAINVADADTIMAIALLLLSFALLANWGMGRLARSYAHP